MFLKSNYMYHMFPSRMQLLSSLLFKFLSKHFRVSKAPASDYANGTSEFAVAIFLGYRNCFFVLEKRGWWAITSYPCLKK